MITPLAESLRTRTFSAIVELVASGLKREADLLEIASQLATVPDVVAGSITSYAGGAIGQDVVRVAAAVRARGLTPNIHLTCIGQDRDTLRSTLQALRALGMYNVFALTGDSPPGSGTAPMSDLDSVQLTQLIAAIRAERGVPFHIAVAVSPFTYQREDALNQYLRLEKKLAAGADLVITQAGWDARKFRELKTYLADRELGHVPVLGNVYVLSRRAAEKMATGTPPGCWAPPALVAAVQQESESADGGLAARIERAAAQVAVLKGLRYAGAYIGGTHDAMQINRILERARELESEWETCYEQLQFGDPNGFYQDAAPAPHA